MFIAFSLILGSCNGQNVKNENQSNSKDILGNLNNMPNEDIKVNKEYDEDGNLTRYDSTYTYYYSNIDKNIAAKDSIYENFRKMFEMSYPFSNKSYFNDLFFQDTLLKYDFYKDNFFLERFRQNSMHLDRMFLEMDSLKNKFFMEQFPKDKE